MPVIYSVDGSHQICLGPEARTGGLNELCLITLDGTWTFCPLCFSCFHILTGIILLDDLLILCSVPLVVLCLGRGHH